MIITIVIVLLFVICFFLFRKKDQAISSANTPAIDYKILLTTHITYYRQLDEQAKIDFERRVTIFLQDTHIEGVGTDVTEVDKIMIASSAVIPVFGFPEWNYRNLTNVILYPDTFDQEFQFEGGNRNILGMVGSGYMNGQMLLSRAALLKGFSENNGKENTAIHEFVHLLDASDGATDGVPENLISHDYALPWLKMMHQEMHKIEVGKSDIDPYALTNEAEFFAVASEYFFEKPNQFKHKHPDLYRLLSQAFAQNPAKVE